MVNENFNKFNKIQQDHKGQYLGGEKTKNKPSSNMDKDVTIDSVGAAGRDVSFKKK